MAAPPVPNTPEFPPATEPRKSNVRKRRGSRKLIRDLRFSVRRMFCPNVETGGSYGGAVSIEYNWHGKAPGPSLMRSRSGCKVINHCPLYLRPWSRCYIFFCFCEGKINLIRLKLCKMKKKTYSVFGNYKKSQVNLLLKIIAFLEISKFAVR